MDDAFAQLVEAGVAVHLSFDGFEPVDVAFGGAGTVGQAQPGGDGGQVLADPGGEGVQFGLVRRRPPARASGGTLFSGALLDGRYLGPSLYGFQLAAFPDRFDCGQVLVIASEMLCGRPPEALTAVLVTWPSIRPPWASTSSMSATARWTSPSRACAIWTSASSCNVDLVIGPGPDH
jgi:hypothetical protein